MEEQHKRLVTGVLSIEAKLPLGYEFLGERTVKHIVKPVGAYKVVTEPSVTGKVGPGSKPKEVVKRMPV